MVKNLPPILKDDPKLKTILKNALGYFVNKIAGIEVGTQIVEMLIDIPFVSMEEVNDNLSSYSKLVEAIEIAKVINTVS